MAKKTTKKSSEAAKPEEVKPAEAKPAEPKKDEKKKGPKELLGLFDIIPDEEATPDMNVLMQEKKMT